MASEDSRLTRTVIAGWPNIKHSTISEIIHNPSRKCQTTKYNDFTLPFVNCKHRSRVRVVDFFPPELELFAHCTTDRSWDEKAKHVGEDRDPRKLKWEWGFALLLEDAKIPPNTVSEKLRVLVNNESAQHLLNLNAKEYVSSNNREQKSKKCVVSSMIRKRLIS